MKDKKKRIGFSFAWNGLKEVLRTEKNFQLQFILFITVLLASIYFGLSSIEWALLLLTSGIVFIAEMFNSAIERIIDYIKPEIHPMAKLIKDIAASAVLVAAIISVIVGFIIFLPKIVKFFI
ncbi:diacylglycerol kinase family protein [Virgibacillus sp. W0430]|uniref:diacylglycerol kinase family protein n=1 Tax=Virgibacillus sp. W0430 TaxID=3391580 RepID=UPI003F45887B